MTNPDVTSELNHPYLEWTNWLFSAQIAEAIFASWAADTYPDAGVRWWTSRKPWDVKWDDHAVDVKDAFIGPARQQSGESVECLGFMGTDRGPGQEARDSVTHYGLVVRTLPDGSDRARVHSDGTVTITATASCRIYLVPRDIVNTFQSEYTKTGQSGRRRNRHLPLPAVEQYLVFDNRQALAGRDSAE